jgi:hypothetical protein
MHVLFDLGIPVSQLFLCWIFKSLRSDFRWSCKWFLPRVICLLFLINVCPLKIILSVVLPFVWHCLSQRQTYHFIFAVYIRHSNLTFFFVSADSSFFDRSFQVLFIWLNLGSVVVAWPRRTDEIRDLSSAKRLRRTWSILKIGVPHWRSWNSEWLISVMAMTTNTRVVYRHWICRISVLITAWSAFVLWSNPCFFLISLCFHLRFYLRQFVWILFCNFVELSLETLLGSVLALVFFVRVLISVAWFQTCLIQFRVD